MVVPTWRAFGFENPGSTAREFVKLFNYLLHSSIFHEADHLREQNGSISLKTDEELRSRRMDENYLMNYQMSQTFIRKPVQNLIDIRLTVSEIGHEVGQIRTLSVLFFQFPCYTLRK